MRDLVPESHFVCLVSRTSLSFSVLAGFLPEISLRRELIDSLFEKGVVPGNGEANTKCLYLSWSPLCATEACFCRNLLKSHVRYIAELSCEGTEEGVFIHQPLCSISQWLPHGVFISHTTRYLCKCHIPVFKKPRVESKSNLVQLVAGAMTEVKVG